MTEYNPDAPSMDPQGVSWGRHPPPSGPPVYGRGQRELINVPVANSPEHQPAHHHHHHQGQQQGPHHHQQNQQNQQSQQQQSGGNPLKRKQAFDFNRLGPKQRALHNPGNCSLELKKVPRSLNNITQLNNHFSKFGKIVNIQVSFGGDQEAALVTFSMPSEAKSAYRSTEAVLNNRFIKVFWHNTVNSNATTGASENVPPGKTACNLLLCLKFIKFDYSLINKYLTILLARQSVKERLGATVATAPVKADDNEYVPTRRVVVEDQQASQLATPQQTQQVKLSAPHQKQLSQPVVPLAAKAPKVIPVVSREDKVLAIKKTQEMLAVKETLKKKQEEKRKEAIKLTADLRKRKQELLDKQLIEMKQLIDRAEKHPDQKDALIGAIKAMQQSIDSLRKDLATGNSTPAPAPTKPLPKTREQAQKEILDAELDLITAQQEGQDSTELQKRYEKLFVNLSDIITYYLLKKIFLDYLN